MNVLDGSNMQDLQKLLDSYNVQIKSAEETPTLMEIADFPRWENVYSNILAFLLDSRNPHKFGLLFIRSLMEIYSDRCPPGWPMEGVDPKDIRVTQNVEREARTTNNKRVDIIVKCDDFVVCIENKIWAKLYNDLGEYREYCQKEFCHEKRDSVVGIVLSPNRVNDQQLQDNRFVSITYNDLVSEICRHMGDYIGPHNTQYQYLLFDFLEQASRFSRGNKMTDEQRAFFEFWRKNEEKIRDLQSQCDDAWGELRKNRIAQKHIDQCEVLLDEKSKKNFFDTGVWRKYFSHFILPKGIEIDDHRVFLDVEFHPLRVVHSICTRKNYNMPENLAIKISKKCDVKFDKDSDSYENSVRFKYVNEQSPLDESVREEAVKASVDILKAIAKLSEK